MFKYFPTSILVTAGFGDLLTIESYLTEGHKEALETIYYASPRNEQLAQLWATLPNYPNLKTHYVFDGVTKGLHTKAEVQDYLELKQIRIPNGWDGVEDWSILPIFQRVNSGNLKYQGSSFLKYELTSRWDLPPNYIVICPDTETDKALPRRSFYPVEWERVLAFLKLTNLTGVVVNTGKHPVPIDPNIIDLSNKTTMIQAIEILKRAKGYFGIDSWLSVLAAKLFSPPLLYIKSNNPHLEINKHIYYAPCTRFPFVIKRLFNG